MIRVAVADDHPLFREGLRKALSLGADLQLVGEASDGQQALTICTEHRPDVLVLDLTMPRCDGFGVLERIKRVAPATQVLVLTAHLEREYELKALAAGARAFLQKDGSVEVILKAIRAVAAGEVWASRLGSAQALAKLSPDHPLAGLTSRERNVLALLGRGMMNREVAAKTGLSEKTVASHIASVISKLGVRGRVDAALMARRYAPLLDQEETEVGS
jgi:two-component system, NarL family, nitrate/nitrite response regulator NarL